MMDSDWSARLSSDPQPEPSTTRRLCQCQRHSSISQNNETRTLTSDGRIDGSSSDGAVSAISLLPSIRPVITDHLTNCHPTTAAMTTAAPCLLPPISRPAGPVPFSHFSLVPKYVIPSVGKGPLLDVSSTLAFEPHHHFPQQSPACLPAGRRQRKTIAMIQQGAA